MLDVNNEVDQFALHFVFLPVVQIQLDIFNPFMDGINLIEIG